MRMISLPPARALSVQYFLYFGVMGVFLPYFNLYCYHLGYSGAQIGVLSAVRSVALIVFPMVWSALADRFASRRRIFIGCNLLSAAVWGMMLMVTEFPVLVCVIAVYGIFYAPIISFMEAGAMDALGRDKSRYGRLRAWGSISFIVTVLVLGQVLAGRPIRLILWLILIGAGIQAILSPTVPAPASVRHQRPGKQPWRAFGRSRMVVFFACGFLMLVSHGTYYGFFSIHLETLGFGRPFIGAAWALASTAEISVMIFSARIFNRFSLERVLATSLLVAVIRWLMLCAFHNAGWILIAQLLHAVTYGTFHMASILYVDRHSPVQAKTVGQALNNAFTYGLGLMIGFAVSGPLYDRWGASRLFLASALMALAGFGLFIAGHMRSLRAS